MNKLLDKTLPEKQLVREKNWQLILNGKKVDELFASKDKALEYLRGEFRGKGVSTYPDNSGVVWKNPSTALVKFRMVQEAQDKDQSEWQSEKVLTYIRDLLQAAGKEDLVVAMDGTELLLKAQGKVFKVNVEKVL